MKQSTKKLYKMSNIHKINKLIKIKVHVYQLEISKLLELRNPNVVF